MSVPTVPGILGLYRRVIGLLAADRSLVWMLALANVALAALQFIEPILFGRVVDILARAGGGGGDGLASGALADSAATLGLWALLGVGGIAANVFVAWRADMLAHRHRLRMMERFFGHVLALPPSFHDATHSARLLRAGLQGSDHLFALWLGFFRDHLASFVALFVLLPLTLFLNWRLALLLITLLVLFAVVTWFVVIRTQDEQGKVEAFHAELAAKAGDALGNVVLIQSFVRLGSEIRSLRDLTDRLLAAQFPVLGWWAIVAVLTRAASTLTILAMFALGAWLVSRGEATVGEIVTFMGFATALIARLEQILGFVRNLFFQRHLIAELFEHLDTVSPVVEKAPPVPIVRAQGRVTFEAVDFAYEPGRAALEKLDFTIEPGMRTAIVGHSGAGKSTVLALLLRLYDPNSGAVRLDDIDLRDLSLDSLRRQIGVVFQNNTLFERSIADNLRIGRADATDQDLIEAAKLAQAHEFIAALPDGYQTLVGERGVRLSGGQRQRLAIARVILKDPPILLLDEATSALDAATESRLQIALDAVMQGRTSITIAHRLSTIKGADLVLVLDRGRLVESGRYTDLLERRGAFFDLVSAQREPGLVV